MSREDYEESEEAFYLSLFPPAPDYDIGGETEE